MLRELIRIDHTLSHDAFKIVASQIRPHFYSSEVISKPSLQQNQVFEINSLLLFCQNQNLTVCCPLLFWFSDSACKLLHLRQVKALSVKNYPELLQSLLINIDFCISFSQETIWNEHFITRLK